MTAASRSFTGPAPDSDPRPRQRRTPAALAGAALVGLAWTARAEDVNINANVTTGVNLDTFVGTTARVFPGITVTNTGTLIGVTFPGIFASTQAWTLNNDGTINA